MEVLLTALAVMLLMLLVAVLTMVVAFVVARRSLRRRNRVSPEVRSEAPTSWLGRPDAAARLHRRLRAAVAVARQSATNCPDGSPLPGLATELEREAIAVDEHLVAVARLPRPDRRDRLAPLAERVTVIERAASQMSVHSVQARAPMVGLGEQDALSGLADRLDALEAARHEVAATEAEAGVRRSSPYARGT